MTTEEKARLAQELLDNPILGMAVADLKEDLLNKWANSDAFDKEGREAAYVFHRALSMIHARVQGYVQELIIETHNREQLNRYADL